MFIVEQLKGETASLPAKLVEPKQIKALTSKLAMHILEALAQKPSYPKEVANQLNVHEQKVYYHIRKLEKAKLIEVEKKIQVGGTQANVYALTQPAFVVALKKFQMTKKALGTSSKDFLEPFVENGELKATIIVGSPDPHGPEKARSRDGYYGIDFALFLGSFLNYVPNLNVKLDTEANRDDLANNLILIGGPIVNTVVGSVNQKLPISFDEKQNYAIVSQISGKKYFSDECGIIVKIKNPFNPKKSLLVIAGKRYPGTRAVMIAFLQHFSEIIKGNKHNPKIMAKIVEGIDLNADGIVDSVEFLE